MTQNFAITGVGGFVAPRHLKAIRDTGNRLVAAVDPHDAVGVLDRYSFDVRFFTEIERFDRHLEKLRRGRPRPIASTTSRSARRTTCTTRTSAWRCASARTRSARSRSSSTRGTSTRCRSSRRRPGAASTPSCSCGCIRQLVALSEQMLAAPAKRPRGEADLHHRARPLVRRVVEGLRRAVRRRRRRTSAFISSTCCSGCSVRRRSVRGASARADSASPAISSWSAHACAGFCPTDAGRPAVRRRSQGRETTFRSITVDGEEVEFTEGFTDLHTRGVRGDPRRPRLRHRRRASVDRAGASRSGTRR